MKTGLRSAEWPETQHLIKTNVALHLLEIDNCSQVHNINSKGDNKSKLCFQPVSAPSSVKKTSAVAGVKMEPAGD